MKIKLIIKNIINFIFNVLIICLLFSVKFFEFLSLFNSIILSSDKAKNDVMQSNKKRN